MQSPLSPALTRQLQTATAMQDFQTIAGLLGQAAAQNPSNFELRIHATAALGQCGRYALCRQGFKALLAEVPEARKTEFRGVIGTVWRNLGRHEAAEPHLRALASAPGSPVGAHEAWIDALEHLNRVEEAQAAAEQALRRFPDYPTLVFLSGRLHRRQGRLDLAESFLRQCLALPAASPALAVEARYELGHLLDAQGRYREAFLSFSAAKAGPLAASADDLRLWRIRTGQLQNHEVLPTAADFKRWAEPPPGWTGGRQAFLVGCPRSGTTLLERVLDAHPAIVAAPETFAWRGAAWLPLLHELQQAAGPLAAPPGEVDLLNGLSPAQITACFKRYRQSMEENLEDVVGSRLLVDKNPSYFSMLAPVARLCPGAKLLVALRDPRAVVWSCFTQPFPLNAESVAFMELGTAVEHTATWLERWLRLRGRLAAPWREVRYENMVQDLPGEARATLDFLGVPWDDKVLSFHQNKAPVRSPSYASASQPVHAGALDKWRHYEAFLTPHLDRLGPVMRELGYA